MTHTLDYAQTSLETALFPASSGLASKLKKPLLALPLRQFGNSGYRNPFPKFPNCPESQILQMVLPPSKFGEKLPLPTGESAPEGATLPGRGITGTRHSSTHSVVKDSLTTELPIILSLDLGTTTGWALRNRHGQIVSGTAHFKPQRFEGGGMRYLRFESWLNEMQEVSGGIDAIYFEEVRRHLGVDAAHAYGGFLAHLGAWCEHRQIPYAGVPVGTIKKFITGKGNAGKSAVISAVRALGHRPEDDNEADALALLHYAIHHNHGGNQ